MPVFSLLWSTMMTGIRDDEDGMCLHRKKKGFIHQNVILTKAPEILTLALNRNKYHRTLSDLVLIDLLKLSAYSMFRITSWGQTHMQYSSILWLSFEEERRQYWLTPFCNLYNTFWENLYSDDGHIVDVQPIDYYLEDLSLMKGVCMLLYRKGK